jgi:hypothetical protein
MEQNVNREINIEETDGLEYIDGHYLLSLTKLRIQSHDERGLVIKKDEKYLHISLCLCECHNPKTFMVHFAPCCNHNRCSRNLNNYTDYNYIDIEAYYSKEYLGTILEKRKQNIEANVKKDFDVWFKNLSSS